MFKPLDEIYCTQLFLFFYVRVHTLEVLSIIYVLLGTSKPPNASYQPVQYQVFLE